MSRLTRDGTAEPVSRDQILRRGRGQELFIFLFQLTTSRIGNLTRLIHALAKCGTIHIIVVVFTLTAVPISTQYFLIRTGPTDADVHNTPQ